MPRATKSAPEAQPAKKAATKSAAATKGAKKEAPAKKAAATTAAPKAAPAPAKKAAAKKQSPTKKAAAAPKAEAAPAKRTVGKVAPKQVRNEVGAPRKMTTQAKPTDKFLAEQQELLLEERTGYEEAARAHRAEADQLAADMEPGDTQFDDESGEGDSLSVERERDLLLAAQALNAIEEIDRALAKITNGTYGICERCRQPIPKPRLKALPYADLCVACKSGGLTSRR